MRKYVVVALSRWPPFFLLSRDLSTVTEFLSQSLFLLQNTAKPSDASIWTKTGHYQLRNWNTLCACLDQTQRTLKCRTWWMQRTLTVRNAHVQQWNFWQSRIWSPRYFGQRWPNARRSWKKPKIQVPVWLRMRSRSITASGHAERG